tara:strand:- start:40 stop:273 length:234 start_codon:yes stop_codon:yes gene_type:complete
MDDIEFYRFTQTFKKDVTFLKPQQWLSLLNGQNADILFTLEQGEILKKIVITSSFSYNDKQIMKNIITKFMGKNNKF